jgi:hypothetical protein
MAKEKIIIGIDNEQIELKGAELEAFLEMRDILNKERNAIEQKEQELKELKISAYKKLGLTDEEINAIL